MKSIRKIGRGGDFTGSNRPAREQGMNAYINSASGQEGQSLIVIALVLVGLLAIAGLVLDGGLAYAQRRRMQNAADAGAIAGARQLALKAPDSAINASVAQYTRSLGGADDYTATYYPGSTPVGGGEVPGSAVGVCVQSKLSFPTSFAPVLGEPTGKVGASSCADFAPIETPTDIQPLARYCDKPTLDECFVKDQIYDILNAGGPGNIGWLSWDQDVDAGYLARELIPGNPIDYVPPRTHPCAEPDPSVGCWVLGLTGVTNSNDARDYLTEYWKNTGKPMTIVIWDHSELNGSNTDYHIVGFASFVVTKFRLPGQSGGGGGGPCNGGSYICGKFVNLVSNGKICTSDCMQTGLSTVHLIQQ